MVQGIIGQTLGKVTKLLLASAGPLQYFLDSPGETHVHCLEQAYIALTQDGKEEVAKFFKAHHTMLTKGLYWADKGWKNVHHFYSHSDKPGSVIWPGATGECQYYFNRAFALFSKDVDKGNVLLGSSTTSSPRHVCTTPFLGDCFRWSQRVRNLGNSKLVKVSCNQWKVFTIFTPGPMDRI